MSFSEIGRKMGQVLEKESSFSKNSHRKVPPTLRYFQQGRSQGNVSEGKQSQIESKARLSRGVRPRLNQVCPVTAQPLLQLDSTRDEEATTTSSYSAEYDDQEDDFLPAPISHPLPRHSDSIFASLNKQIVNFQKMVADMEQAMSQSGDSPEAQWKTKILIRSSKDAERDISSRLVHEFEATKTSRRRNGRDQMAMRKLSRDFGRIQEQFAAAMQAHEKRQKAEVSLLTAGHENTEEFFDRAMREREEELNDIHTSMRKVNAIYEDLAGIVDSQQEHIDQLVDKVEESKANTKKGMENFHDAMMGVCGPDDETDESDSWPMKDFIQFATSCHTNIMDGGVCSVNSMD
eukprot:scaffold2003_cov139-Cylindrotheca_fusiformis.AAC.8